MDYHRVLNIAPSMWYMGFPGDSVSKESTCKAGDYLHTGNRSSIPGLGRSPGGGNDYPLQYFCLGNPMDRGARQAAVHGVTKGIRHDLVTKLQQKHIN